MSYADDLGALEPLRAHHFKIQITSTGTGAVLDDAEFSLAIVEGFTPAESSDEIEIQVDSERRYYAGKTSYETGSLTIRDYCDANVADFLIEWRKRVFDPTNGTMGYKAEYAGTGVINQYDPKGALVRQWKIKGIWPQAVNYGTPSQDTTDPISISVTFRYDTAIPVVY